MSTEASTAPEGHAPSGVGPLGRVRDRAQLGLGAALAVVALVVILDAARLGPVSSSNDPIGPKAMPFVVGGLLLVVAVLYVLDVLRGGAGEAEEGEDVELGQRADWKTVGVLAGAFVLNALLIEPLGWVISGAILFALSAFALGNRHHVRGLAVGIAMSLSTFYAFAIGLGVNLPAGILQGIL